MISFFQLNLKKTHEEDAILNSYPDFENTVKPWASSLKMLFQNIQGFDTQRKIYIQKQLLGHYYHDLCIMYIVLVTYTISKRSLALIFDENP